MVRASYEAESLYTLQNMLLRSENITPTNVYEFFIHVHHSNGETWELLAYQDGVKITHVQDIEAFKKAKEVADENTLKAITSALLPTVISTKASKPRIRLKHADPPPLTTIVTEGLYQSMQV